MMTSDCSMGATESGFHSLVIAVLERSTPFKFCSLLISSGMAEKITLNVAWVLHRAGFYLLSSDTQYSRIRVWSFDSFPISLGKAEMHDDDVRL